jgi:hypothetical protein
MAIVFIFLWQSNKYKASKYEMKRHEAFVFKYGSRDSILKIEITLRERLNVLSKENVISKKKEANSIASIASNIVEKKKLRKRRAFLKDIMKSDNHGKKNIKN